MDEWRRLFDAYLPLIALYLQNFKLQAPHRTQKKPLLPRYLVSGSLHYSVSCFVFLSNGHL